MGLPVAHDVNRLGTTRCSSSSIVNSTDSHSRPDACLICSLWSEVNSIQTRCSFLLLTAVPPAVVLRGHHHVIRKIRQKPDIERLPSSVYRGGFLPLAT